MNKRPTPFVIGLTGSVGMGKSTTAGMFRDMGADVWDADAAVSRLYEKGGEAVREIAALNPDLILNGGVDRPALRAWVTKTPDAFKKLEAIVHPLVERDRNAFLSQAKSDIVVLEIPLLLETGKRQGMDLIAVVSAPQEEQRRRVLDRPGVSEEMFDLILSKQMPNDQKIAKADVVIPTGSFDEARQAVKKLVEKIRAGGFAHA